jgi:hypothetical protein
MGKGDLLFQDEPYCLRGARAECLEPEGFPAFRVDEKHKEVTGYKLPKTPCRLRITTKETRRFDVTILAVTKDGGIDLEYRLADLGTGAAAPANQDWAEVERILYTDTSGKECGIDLDTGKLYTLPKEYNTAVYPRDEIVRWAKDQHIDLFYPAKPGIGQLTCVGLGQRALDNTTWEKGTREDIRDFFTRLGAGKMEAPDTMSPYTTGAAPSYVYAFVTNEGSRGIVQIVGSVGPYEKGWPSGVKIRYRIERPREPHAKLLDRFSTDADNPKPGAPIEKEKLQRLAWGPAAPNGLRAACYFEPTKEAYADGEEVVRRLVFHNGGQEPVLFTLGSSSENSSGDWAVIEEPIPVPVERQFGYGGGWSVAYRLAPNHAAEIEYPPRIRLGASTKAGEGVHAAIQAKPGTTCRAHWSLRVLETMRSENGKQVAVAGVWHGTLTTGEVRFRIVEKDAGTR